MEASSEIQAAARKVLEENQRLRNLLRVKGVSDDEVCIFLQNGVAPTKGDVVAELDTFLSRRKACIPDRHLAETLLGLDEEESPALVNMPQSLHSKLTASGSVETAPQLIDSAVVQKPASNVSSFTGEITNGAPSDSIPHNSDDEGQGNRSSCKAAASILASLRSDGPSIHEVKTDLGCQPDSHCLVDNITLFEIMDRYMGHELGTQVN